MKHPVQIHKMAVIFKQYLTNQVPKILINYNF